MQTEHPHGFHALDALRGIAAISVVFFHFGSLLSVVVLPNAFLSVDFFFVLSGFVIAHAYENRLHTTSLRFRAFMARRFIRLYPLYLFGLAVSAVPFVGDVLLHVPDQRRGPEAGSYALAMLFLPTPAFLWLGNLNVFPMNSPVWSLSLEMAINAVYAVISTRLTLLRLAVLILLSFAALTVAAVHYADFNMGSEGPSYAGGWPRVLCSFFAGIAAYRVHSLKAWPPLPSWVGLLLCVILIDVFSRSASALAFELFSIALFPVAVFLGACVRLQGFEVKAAAWLGGISYPAYIIHVPLANVLIWYKHRAGLVTAAAAGHPHFVHETIFPPLLLWVAVAVLFAWVLHRFYDIPVRTFLSRNLGQSR